MPGYSTISRQNICPTGLARVMQSYARTRDQTLGCRENIPSGNGPSSNQTISKLRKSRKPDFSEHVDGFLKQKSKTYPTLIGIVSDDYGFSTPHYYKTTNYVNSRADGRPINRGYERLISAVPLNDQPWVQEYDPYPDMFIPYKYRDIIPKDPLYMDSGDYIMPGSRSWFTYMSDLHRRISSATNSQERNYMLQSVKEREKHKVKLLKKEQALKIEAQFHGTSVHTLPRRKGTIKMLTGKTRHFHERMNYLTTTNLKGKDIVRHEELEAEMESFELYYNSGVNFNQTSRKAQGKLLKEMLKEKEVTSDDTIHTKEMEYRPKKRNTASVTNNFFQIDEDRYKRNRSSEVPIDTTAVAGPSRIKF
ncbi:hypothetical protein RhiirA4_426565 [Rhizophagus irregularis]|uniref:Uncharacterized protein n=1 Tax=Rhizophagus irregularis TaxID=588596 RepID=A0A2I1H5K5_9GLOM|nr:hypothetical protein RhiirA4_426565 [Rhizophagus irregularis]